MKSNGQQAIGRDTFKLTLALWALVVLWSDASIAQPDSLDDVYTTRAVVTGKDERNRPLGFKLCFEDVLVKASGDASIVNDGRFENLAADAGRYISTFSYRDRLEGKPVHDEQDTYDRPHFLTCRFDPQKINGVLKMLGRTPWVGHRPRLVMVVAVHGRKSNGILSSDGDFDADMHEALANAARRYGLSVSLPSVATLQSNQIRIDTAAITPGDRSGRGAGPIWQWRTLLAHILAANEDVGFTPKTDIGCYSITLLARQSAVRFATNAPATASSLPSACRQNFSASAP